MIYLFTGNSIFLVGDAVTNWKKQFISKYGDFNLIHIKNITDKNFLSSNMFSTGFMREKKLVIIELNSDISEDFSSFFIDSLNRIPESNIILFSFAKPDKRQKLYKEIEKVSQKKEFNAENENEIYNTIYKKYNSIISTNAINKIIKYKGNNLGKVINEIEKLNITYSFINEKEIEENIFPEIEESIFQIIDDLLNLKINDSINKIENLTTEVNVYAFYNNLLANLRTSLYISKLKSEKNNSSKISSILNLGNKTFLINKNYKINYNTLKSFYISLINLDKKMKSGKMIGSEEKDFLQEIKFTIIKELK